MSENSREVPQRKGFVSPLQKAQTGKVGGGKLQDASTQQLTNRETQEQRNVSTFERLNTSTQERSNVETLGEEAGAAKKKSREETHFRQTVWMPKVLNRRLKIQAAREGEDISGIINRLVEEYLEKEEA